jgi:apolipoprotein N-acyltransferase
MGPTDFAADESADHLIQTADNEPQHNTLNGSAVEPGRQKRRPLLYLCAILVVMAIPSYLIPAFPFPIDSTSTVPISVACALPPVDKNGRIPTANDYVKETRRLLVEAADVVLWPEGAVMFETAEAKQTLVDTISDVEFLNHAVVAVAFEEYLPANETSRPGMRRNGLMLVTREGVKMEYYKRHLVPCT